MKRKEHFPDHLKQNDKLPIRLVAPGFGQLSPELAGTCNLLHRKQYFFFLLILEGSTRHSVDMEQFDISNNEMLFILPHQMHELPSVNHGIDYFKLGFDEQCLSLLPRQYPFLVNPLNSQKIKFSVQA